MLIPNQKIKMKWNGRNKQHFISLGYPYTKHNDEFEIDVSHLTKGSAVIVKVKCDYCFKDKEIIFNQYYDQVIKNNLDKYCCKECGHIRLAENHKKERKGFKLAKTCNISENRGIVYEIVDDKISELNEDQLILINEIKRFCEENGRFPTEKEMSNKNGYVSRTQFYKTFNTNRFIDIYNYIYPLQMGTRIKEIVSLQKVLNKPQFFKCSKCKIEKEFTIENFPEGKANKFGLRTVCRECENKYAFKLRYKNKGINFENWEDITPEQWWEFLYEGKIGYLPDFCFKEKNIIKIVRYVFLVKLKLNKKDICNYNLHYLKTLKIYHLYTKYYDKFKFLTLCFPELSINIYDLPKSRNVTDDDKNNFIKEWMDYNGYSLSDVLKCRYVTDQTDMKSFVAVNFNSYHNMFVWYFEKNNIKHPIKNKIITISDFKFKPEHYWDDEENRLKCIRNYCEENGIQKVIQDTELLKEWIFNYFRQDMVGRLFNNHLYYKGLYELLITAFPEIIENKILFEWEWHQCNRNDKKFLIKMLREMLSVREKLKTPFEISKFLNHTTLTENGYNKFVKRVQQGIFSNYYEWACLSFPEFKDSWDFKDFYTFVAEDGSICDSLEEVKIYEFIKHELGISNIKAIGTTYKSEHSFDLPKNSKDKWYCPDFVIQDEKPIYIEYFGMYTENPPKDNKLLNSYKNKTLRKINFYDTQPCTFVYLYPEDIKKSFEGLINKLNGVI